MPDAVQAAASAATAVAQEIAAVQAAATDVVAVAQERVAEAQATAQQIADAALQTEIGRRVNEIEGRISGWLGEINNQLEAFRSRFSAMEATTAELVTKASQTPQVTVTTVAPPSPSTLAPLAEEAPQVTVTTVESGSQENAVVESPAPVTPQRRYRII